MAMDNFDTSGDAALGRGIAFPLRLGGGNVGMNAFETQIEQSIRLILRTAPGERVMRPDFGAGTDRLAFEPVNAVTAALLQHRIQEALARFEPRIDVQEVSVSADPEGGALRAEIAYRVKRTDAVANMVYPFYVERGEA